MAPTSTTETHASAASSFQALQMDRAAAAAAVAGANASRRQSQALLSNTQALPGRGSHVTGRKIDPTDISTDEEMDDLAHEHASSAGASLARLHSSALGQDARGEETDDVGDETDPLGEPQVDSSGRLITPPALELGKSAVDSDD
ncbi:hypothetical protein V8E36_005595 [Tilletia maclaganii]